jgi:hypothetical protein
MMVVLHYTSGCTKQRLFANFPTANRSVVGHRHQGCQLLFHLVLTHLCRSQCGLRRRSSAARLLRSWVRIPPTAWMFVCCECCVLSGRGLWDGLITRPEESYRMWRVFVCDKETSKKRRLKPATGLWKLQPQWVVTPGKQTNKH